MFLLVGLGNPGKSYINNRHNIGYKVIDNIKNDYDFPNFIKKFKSDFSKKLLDNQVVSLIKPITYMNDSGIAVKEVKKFYNIDLNNIYVIHDEIDLDQGRVKIKNGGGHNGHNGLKSIDKLIGHEYNRVRVGISRPSKIYDGKINENISNWVLSDFTSIEKEQWLNDTIINISETIIRCSNNDLGTSFIKNFPPQARLARKSVFFGNLNRHLLYTFPLYIIILISPYLWISKYFCNMIKLFLF